MKFRYLHIEYANPDNLTDSITANFKLQNHNVTEKWVARVLLAKTRYSIDDPTRFYGLGSYQSQIDDALLRINSCIDSINSHGNIIEKKLLNINDQDTLNYLHHIFEVYHGLLDQQTHEFYLSAPHSVRQSLAELNLLVHRCETVSRNPQPRHVVTWFGLPKTQTLNINDYDLFTDNYKFGTVYLNYVEIGKTLEDLTLDDDHYIAPEAFQPFKRFSADFNVKFYNSDPVELKHKHQRMSEFYSQNKDFFQSIGLDESSPYLKPGSIPLADLEDCKNILKQLESRQYVKNVSFS